MKTRMIPLSRRDTFRHLEFLFCSMFPFQYFHTVSHEKEKKKKGNEELVFTPHC